MEEAIKSISTRRGYDLREFSLIAFGGAGPLHAGAMALNLNIPEVVVPPWPGVTSALGLLLSQVRHDYVKSRLNLLGDLSVQDILSVWKELEETALEGLLQEGFQQGQWRFEHFLDLRYAGQGYELSIPVDPEGLQQEGIDGLRRQFDEEHRVRHGHSAGTQAVELVNYRVVIYGLLKPVELPEADRVDYPVSKAIKAERPLYFPAWQEFRGCPIYDRTHLGPGHQVEGPAIIEQYDSTVVVAPGQAAEIDSFNNLILHFQ
jgi:N-methylhydantoinase A